MVSRSKIRAALTEAMEGQQMLRLHRVSRREQRIDGFIVAVGRSWALARTVDGGFFDGYVAIRLREVCTVRPDTSFETAHARTQPEWPPRLPPTTVALNLDTTSGMLRSLLRADMMFGIEQNKKVDATWIGVPNELTRRWLYLWEVRPDSSWHDQPLGYKLRRLTIVEFGGRYQRGLAAVAGSAPDGASADWAS